MNSMETRIIVSARDMATSTMRKLELSLEGVRRRAYAVGGLMAGGLGLAYVAKQSIEAADKIGKVADKVGLSTDALQELRYSADLSGVGITQLDMGMQRFSRRLGEVAQGTGELKNTAEQYGIQLRDSNGQMRSNIDILGDFADVIQGAESEQEALRIAFKLFDSEGASLVNMLRGGSKGLNQMRQDARDLGVVLDEDLIRNSEKANDQLTRLGSVVSAQLTSAVVSFAPEIATVTGNMLDWVKANRGLIEQKTHEAVNKIKDSAQGLVDVYESVPSEVLGAAGYGIIGTIALGANPGKTIALLKLAQGLGESWGNAALQGVYGLSDENMAKIEEAKGRSYIKDLIDALLPDAGTGEKNFNVAIQGGAEAALSGDIAQVAALWGKAHPQVSLNAASGGSNGGVDIDLKTIKAVNKELKAAFKDYATNIETVRDEYARLTMNEEELARYTFEDKYGKLVEVLGKANPELEEYAQLQRQVLDALATTPEQDRLLEIAENRRGAFDLLHEVDADAVRLAQAEALAGSKERDLQLISQFSEKYRATVLGDSGYAMAQIEAQAEAYRQAGADEVAVAQWTAEEKLAASRDWTDGAQRALDEYADSATNAAANMANVVGGAFQGMEDALVDFVRTGKLSFSDLTDSIVADMARMAVRQSVTGPLSSGLLSLFSAQGNAFGADGLMPFAKGGAFTNSIVTSPTVFPFASGIGLMGEAGPEAILPLTRTASGDLGVKASATGGGQGISIAIHNESGQEMRVADARVTQSGQRQMVEIWIDALERNVGGLRTILGG